MSNIIPNITPPLPCVCSSPDVIPIISRIGEDVFEFDEEFHIGCLNCREKAEGTFTKLNDATHAWKSLIIERQAAIIKSMIERKTGIYENKKDAIKANLKHIDERDASIVDSFKELKNCSCFAPDTGIYCKLSVELLTYFCKCDRCGQTGTIEYSIFDAVDSWNKKIKEIKTKDEDLPISKCICGNENPEVSINMDMCKVGSTYNVWCNKCDANGGFGGSRRDVIKKWNAYIESLEFLKKEPFQAISTVDKIKGLRNEMAAIKTKHNREKERNNEQI